MKKKQSLGLNFALIIPVLGILVIALAIMTIFKYNLGIFPTIINNRKGTKLEELNWTSSEFIFDGNKYKLNDLYSNYEKNGWEVDPKEVKKIYGSSTIEKGGIVPSIKLTNYKYPDAVVEISITNLSDKKNHFSKCNVNSISVFNSMAKDIVSFELPGTIKYGSSEEEIKKIYSSDKLEISKMDKTKKAYKYTNNYKPELIMFINNSEKGLEDFSYNYYN